MNIRTDTRDKANFTEIRTDEREVINRCPFRIKIHLTATPLELNMAVYNLKLRGWFLFNLAEDQEGKSTFLFSIHADT